MVVCISEKYREAAQVHTSKDPEVTWEGVTPTITTMNRAAKRVVQMLRNASPIDMSSHHP